MLRALLVTTLVAACSPGVGEGDIAPPIQQQCEDDGREAGALEWDHQEGLIEVVDLATSPAGDIARVGRWNNLEVFDRDGRLRWGETYHGAGIEKNTLPLDLAVDGAGFIHVLVYETILHVLGGNEFSDIGLTRDARLVVRYAPDGAHEWRWVRERPPVEPFEQYSPSGGLGVADGSLLLLEMALDEPTVVIALDRSGVVVAETELAVPYAGAYGGWLHDFDPDGDVYLGGRTPGGLSWLGRFARDGSLAWHHEFTDTPDVSESEMMAVVAGAEDDVYAAWTHYDGPSIESHVRRLGTGGELLWTDMLPGVRVHDGARVLAAGCESAVAFSGDVMGPFVFTLWVGAYSAEGARTWSYLRASDEGASGQRIAVAHDGDVIVSGNIGSYPWLGRLAVR